MSIIDLHDRCRMARNRLRANANYYTRKAAKTKRYEEKIRRLAKADAYTRAANILSRAIA